MPILRATFFLACSALVALACHGQSGGDALPQGESASPKAVVKEMAPEQLQKMLTSPAVTVYDCNEPDMHAEAHVPGAKPMVYDEVTADKLPHDLNATIVFYCYSPECPAAATAARTAMGLGFTDVYCMTAGIIGWQDAGLKTEP